MSDVVMDLLKLMKKFESADVEAGVKNYTILIADSSWLEPDE